MELTYDQKFLFVATDTGSLIQCHINESDGKTNNVYEDLHNGVIYSISVSTDSKYLFTSDETGCAKQF